MLEETSLGKARVMAAADADVAGLAFQEVQGKSLAVLDTLLVWQEAEDPLGSASLGSCRKLPSPRALRVLERARPLFEAYDADVEGEAGAQRLHQMLFQSPTPTPTQRQHLIRLRPPVGKDPTSFAQRGGSVRAWLEAALESQRVQAGQKENPDA